VIFSNEIFKKKNIIDAWDWDCKSKSLIKRGETTIFLILS
jgi:hypothetical protein